MNLKKDKPSIIIVLGMHRSGTSLVAQLIAKWGAYMGDDIMKADEFNKDGYWEFNPLVALNDKILAHSDSTWYSPPTSIDVPLLIKAFGDEARSLVTQMDQQQTTWCWKDPRIPFLLPFWQEILKDRDIVYIVSHRNPISIAESLFKRDKMPTIVSLALWQLTMLRISHEIQANNKYYIADYDQLLNIPHDTCNKLFAFLNETFNHQEDNSNLDNMLLCIKPDFKTSKDNTHQKLNTTQEKLNYLFKSGNIQPYSPFENDNLNNDIIEILTLYQKSVKLPGIENYAQFYISTPNKGFNERDSIRYNFHEGSTNIKLDLSRYKNIHYLRFDPLNNWVTIIFKKLELYSKGKLIAEITEFTSNAFISKDDLLIFITTDPQITFDISCFENEPIDQAIIYQEYISTGITTKAEFAEDFVHLMKELNNGLQIDIADLTPFDEIKTGIKSKFESIWLELETAKNSISSQEEINAIKQSQINEITNKFSLLNQQYSIIIDEKTELLTEKESSIQELENSISKLEIDQELLINQLTEKEIILTDRQNQINKKERIIFSQQVRLDQYYQDIVRLKKSPFFKLSMFINGLLLLFKPKHLLLLRKEFVRISELIKTITNSGYFNKSFYLKNNPDVAKSRMNPAKHFLQFGGFEGRNPSDKFDTTYYAQNNPDVLEVGMNPLLHYILYGKSEGRQIQPIINDTLGLIEMHLDSTQKVEVIDKPINNDLILTKNEETFPHLIETEEITIIRDSGMFDPDYYCSQYDDIKRAGVDPLKHYFYTGWRENRNPNSAFNTAYYLISNPDVAASSINPFYHYITSGKQEGRLTSHPCEIKVNILSNSYLTIPVIKDTAESLKSADPVEILSSFIVNILSSDKKGFCFSFSHDDYTTIVGGVQLCIIEEQKAFSENNYGYIHLSPSNHIPVQITDQLPDGYLLRIIIDGKNIGCFNSNEVIAFFKDHFLNSENNLLIIHSLLGHENEFISKFASSISFNRKFFWLHDYYSICPGYNLLRNNVEFCNAPVIESNACQLCIHYVGRRILEEFISELFKKNLFEVISPSLFTLNLWKEKSQLPFKESHVLNHRKLLQTGELIQNKTKNETHIAYIGFPSYHKGWHEFEQLVKEFGDDNRYLFFHIGLNSTHNPKIKFIESKISVLHPDKMIKNLKKYDFDYCFIWPKWSETYCITAFESIISGALVLTNNNSGNVKEMVELYGKGLCYNTLEELKEDLSSGTLIELIQTERSNGKYLPNYSKSKMTYSIVSNEEA